MKNMKPFLKTLFLFLLFGQLKAQVIPTNSIVAVSYDVEITTYKQVANNTDLNLLNDFEKTTFKLQKVRKTVQKYLNSQNELTTAITYGTRDGFEGTSEDVVKKVIMDKNGIFHFGAQNQLLESQPVSAEAQEINNVLRQNMTAEKFESIPDFSSPTPAMIQAAQASGYQMTATPTAFTVKNATDEFTYDSTKRMLENKVFKNGQPFSIKKTYYSTNNSGRKVPALKIEKSYEVSTAGVTIEVVQIEKITNFVRTTR